MCLFNKTSSYYDTLTKTGGLYGQSTIIINMTLNWKIKYVVRQPDILPAWWAVTQFLSHNEMVFAQQWELKRAELLYLSPFHACNSWIDVSNQKNFGKDIDYIMVTCTIFHFSLAYHASEAADNN